MIVGFIWLGNDKQWKRIEVNMLLLPKLIKPHSVCLIVSNDVNVINTAIVFLENFTKSIESRNQAMVVDKSLANNIPAAEGEQVCILYNRL